MAVIFNASTSSGLVTTADNSGQIAFQTNGTQYNPTLIAATPQSSTSGTAIDFTGIPSWVKRVTLSYNAVSTTGTSNYQVQLGISSGVETTGYLANATTIAGSTTGFSITTGFAVIIAPSAANSYSGVIVFSLVSTSNNSWSAMGMGSAGTTTLHTAAGGKTLSGTLDRVRFTTANGTDTFDAGTINIMYE
jgi:hypothetical protein